MFKKYLLALFLVPIALFGENDKSYYYSVIQDAWKTKVFDAAIVVVEKAIAQYPDEPDFYSNLVYMYTEVKKYKSAYDLGMIAYKKFPNHSYVKDSYELSLALHGYGLYEEKQYDKALSILENAYKRFPDYKWIANNYAVVLRYFKQYDKALSILEQWVAVDAEPVIKENLSWTYYDKGTAFFEAGKKDESYVYFKKAYDSGKLDDVNVPVSYLYKLSHLKRFDEAFEVMNKAYERFGRDEKLYDPVFWVYFNLADNYMQEGKYREMLAEYLDNLYPYARPDVMTDEGLSHRELTLMRLHTDMSTALGKICPYWLTFTPEAKAKAYDLLEFYDKHVADEARFLYLDFLGSVLYREGKKEEAVRVLDEAYEGLTGSPYGANHTKELDARFPLSGTYIAGSNESTTYITHMGFLRFCYDITGSDEKGNMLKPGTKGTNLFDYYGFGALIRSPFAGTITEVTDGSPDAPPSGTVSGEINYVHLSTEEGYHVIFVHIKQHSAKVKIGAKVHQGDPIAELGNAQSTYPHLHIGVFSKDWIVTQPLYFLDYSVIKDGIKTKVKKGRPGGPDGFEVIEVK